MSFTSFTPVFCILIGKCHFTAKAFLLTFNTAGSISSAIIRMGCGVLEEVSMCTCINWDIKDVKGRGAHTRKVKSFDLDKPVKPKLEWQLCWKFSPSLLYAFEWKHKRVQINVTLFYFLLNYYSFHPGKFCLPVEWQEINVQEPDLPSLHILFTRFMSGLWFHHWHWSLHSSKVTVFKSECLKL